MSFDPEATQRASPPVEPFGPRLALTDLMLALLLGSCVFIAIGMLAPDTWLGYYALHLWLPLLWLGGLVFGGELLAYRGPWLTRATRLTQHQFIKNGGGAYGAIAVIVFGWLEWDRMISFWLAVLALSDKWELRDLIRGFFDFGLDSIMNAVWSAAWPAFWQKTFTGGQIWPAIGVSWALFEGVKHGVRLLPRRGGSGPASPMGGAR